MSTLARVAFCALMLLIGLFSLALGLPAFFALVLGASAVLLSLPLLARRSPERVTIVLAVIVVAAGTLDACIRVVQAIDDDEVTYAGKLNLDDFAHDVVAGRPERDGPHAGSAFLSEASGVMTQPQAGQGLVTWWAARQLAPWLLASVVLILVIPILRAAESDDPFSTQAADRLALIGTLVLVGVPGIAVLGYVVAEAGTGDLTVGPGVSPELTLSPLLVLPGVFVLVLARVFRRGAELREFDRSAI